MYVRTYIEFLACIGSFKVIKNVMSEWAYSGVINGTVFKNPNYILTLFPIFPLKISN